MSIDVVRARRTARRTLAVLGCALWVAAASALPAAAEGPVAPSALVGGRTIAFPLIARSFVDPSALPSRYGAGAPLGQDVSQYSLTALGGAWYWDWSVSEGAAAANGLDYMPNVRLTQSLGPGGERLPEYTYTPDAAAIRAYAEAHPGATWLIGNEPDRRYWQDDVEPAVYAEAYAELYDLIKTADPTALVAAGQIVQPTPLRLRYLDMVLDHYAATFGRPMPVDVWAIHAYPLREDAYAWGADIPPGIDDVTLGLDIEIEDTADPALFKGFVEAFRAWMAERGYQSRPLIITEFGVLMDERIAGMGPGTAVAYLQETLNYLASATGPTGYPADNNRLVQRWAWYVLAGPGDTEVWGEQLAGRLYTTETGLRTATGEAFARFTSAVPRTVNLRVAGISAQPAVPFAPGEPVDVRLTAQVVNNGEVGSPRPVRVRFYSGDPAAGGYQIGEVTLATLRGGALPALAILDWHGVSEGSYNVYVVVDPLDEVAETDEADNASSRSITVSS